MTIVRSSFARYIMNTTWARRDRSKCILLELRRQVSYNYDVHRSKLFRSAWHEYNTSSAGDRYEHAQFKAAGLRRHKAFHHPL